VELGKREKEIAVLKKQVEILEEKLESSLRAEGTRQKRQKHLTPVQAPSFVLDLLA
jgi:hypothetical protein